MATFRVPDFPLTCNIFTGPFAAKVLRLTSPCNLAWGHRWQAKDNQVSVVPDTVFINYGMFLLLPKLTDVRPYPAAPHQDVIECPAGSSRWYTVVFVDDIGKGFANEHRCAVIAQVFAAFGGQWGGAVWPVPLP